MRIKSTMRSTATLFRRLPGLKDISGWKTTPFSSLRFTAENITRISGEIARYYENAVNHINETENMIKGVLNESFDTEG